MRVTKTWSNMMFSSSRRQGVKNKRNLDIFNSIGLPGWGMKGCGAVAGRNRLTKDRVLTN